MKVTTIAPKFVDSFPGELEPGVLYVSTKFSTASHLCACGCRREVITPLSPTQWAFTFDGTISMWPSVGNWALPCKSHYVIDHGKIRWSRAFTADEVRRNQQADRHLRDDFTDRPEPRAPRRFWRHHSP